MSTRLRPKWLTPKSGSSTIVPPFVRSPLGPFGDIFAPPLTAEEEPLGHKRSRQHAPSALGVRGFVYVGFILYTVLGCLIVGLVRAYKSTLVFLELL